MRQSLKLRRGGMAAMGAPAAPGGPVPAGNALGVGPETTVPEGTGAGSGGRVAPAALRSFLRNFLSDDLGSFRSEINLKDHGDQSGTEVRDVTVQEVADMHPDLRSLTLSGCDQITDVGIWALARSCTALRELRMTGVHIRRGLRFHPCAAAR